MTVHTRDLRDAILRTNFYAFGHRSFEELKPGSRIEKNWHLEAIAGALDRVMAGQVKRLIINAPPRSLKSFFGSVALPAFALGQNPTQSFICVSYNQDLSADLSSDCRRLMETDFYKKLFPNVSLEISNQSELQTREGGSRYATSVGGTLTGRGANILIIDDPLNADDAH